MHEDLTITLGVEDELHRVSEIIRDGSSADQQVDHFSHLLPGGCHRNGGIARRR